MTDYTSVANDGVLAHHVYDSAIDECLEFESVCLIEEDLMRQSACCWRSFGSDQRIESKLPGIRKDVWSREDHCRMPNFVALTFASEDDLPA